MGKWIAALIKLRDGQISEAQDGDCFKLNRKWRKHFSVVLCTGKPPAVVWKYHLTMIRTVRTSSSSLSCSLVSTPTMKPVAAIMAN